MDDKKKILIVEDDAFLGDVLLQKLKLEGYDASLVRDGAEGLKVARDQKPDLILLDIVLPTMNGYEILEAKHSDASINKIPVIVISNSGQPVEIARALSLGVKDYMVKAQLDPQDVVAKVKKFFDTAAEAPAGRLKGRIILWVEDDKFLSDLLSTKLGREGCISLYAENGERALNILQTERPDIILLDLVLPGMSGFDVLAKVKSTDEIKDIPVMVLSNLSQEADIQKAKQLGAVSYLVKAQNDPDDIMKEVAHALG